MVYQIKSSKKNRQNDEKGIFAMRTNMRRRKTNREGCSPSRFVRLYPFSGKVPKRHLPVVYSLYQRAKRPSPVRRSVCAL